MKCRVGGQSVLNYFPFQILLNKLNWLGLNGLVLTRSLRQVSRIAFNANRVGWARVGFMFCYILIASCTFEDHLLHRCLIVYVVQF